MGFQEAVRTCFEKYITISGRAPRSEYWWWIVFLIVANIVLGFLDGLVFGWSEDSAAILGPLFGLAVFLPSICVAGRRLHDRDMSAWWLLLMLIPVIGSLILLVIYALPGTPGPNRFGPDPLGQGGGGRAPNVWDADDESFTRSNIPHTGGDERR
jgi:uncharacterized membrane protein YhaH (DUF805 family)